MIIDIYSWYECVCVLNYNMFFFTVIVFHFDTNGIVGHVRESDDGARHHLTDLTKVYLDWQKYLK